jgi:hypothetical protein
MRESSFGAMAGRDDSDSAVGTSVGEWSNQKKDVRLAVGASAFSQEISSAIAFADVQIHWELTPRGELMSNEQKKCASKRPSFDF